MKEMVIISVIEGGTIMRLRREVRLYEGDDVKTSDANLGLVIRTRREMKKRRKEQHIT